MGHVQHLGGIQAGRGSNGQIVGAYGAYGAGLPDIGPVGGQDTEVVHAGQQVRVPVGFHVRVYGLPVWTEVVVVGGGVSAAGDLLLEPARAELARSLVGAADRVVPPVIRAAHGPEAGAVGAASMVRDGLGRGARPRRAQPRRPRRTP